MHGQSCRLYFHLSLVVRLNRCVRSFSLPYILQPNPYPSTPLYQLQQIEIVQLLPILQDIPLHLTRIHPRHEILHAPRDQKRRIRHHLRAHPHVPLLHKLDGRRHRLGHAQPRHDDAEAPPGEARDAELALHVAEFEAAGEDAHVVEFGEEELFVLEADGVGGEEAAEEVG